MNPDPDLERLEERVREAFPAVSESHIILQDSRWRPIGESHHSTALIEREETTEWKPFIGPFAHSTGMMLTKSVTVHPPEQP